MTSLTLDLADLAAQLRADGTAYLPDYAVADQHLQEQLRPGDGVVVVDGSLAGLYHPRDLAQDLANATGLDTVIIHSHHAVSAVSSSYSRAAIESAERSVAPGWAPADVVAQFYAAADATVIPWTIIVAAVALIAVAGAVGSFRQAWKPHR